METLLAERLFGVPFAALAAVALAIALVFAVVELNTAGSTGLRWLILRWFHSGCWVLLAIAALLRAKMITGTEALAGPIAIVGGLLYAAYLATMLIGRS